MTDLTGLTAVVTGGNGGIGLGMATGMARAGANIAIWARDEAKSAAAAAALDELGVRTLALTCDVADEAQVAEAMERTVAELGPLGCMVANAGTSDRRTILDSSLDDWHRVLRINLDGTFLTCREAARRFVDQGSGGSIVVVSSMISAFGGAGQGAYAASKTGLLGLSRTLSVELARHRVRVNALIPGWTVTGLSAGGYADDRSAPRRPSAPRPGAGPTRRSSRRSAPTSRTRH
jgi:NAD(P)-dependent dehydrogenase (short-subunit alcohol dehydrogenase family)